MAKVHKIQVDLRHLEKTFGFYLDVEELDFGSAGTLRYYSIGAGNLRRNEGKNGRSAVDFNFSNVRGGGKTIFRDQAETLLLAEAFLRLPVSNSMLKVYRSSYLYRYADRDAQINDTERERLKIVAMGPIEGVREELERLFLLTPLPKDTSTRETLNSVFQELIESGKMALTSNGGLDLWLAQVAKGYPKLRRRGDAKLDAKGNGNTARLFLDFLMTEAYLAFVHCVSGALIAMARVLLEQHQMTETEARLHRFMHGIDGLGVAPDAYGSHRGILYRQSLSFHPIGRILLKDPNYRRVIGEWITIPDYDNVSQNSERMLQDEQYRRLLNVLLLAGHEHELIRKQHELDRGVENVRDIYKRRSKRDGK